VATHLQLDDYSSFDSCSSLHRWLHSVLQSIDWKCRTGNEGPEKINRWKEVQDWKIQDQNAGLEKHNIFVIICFPAYFIILPDTLILGERTKLTCRVTKWLWPWCYGYCYIALDQGRRSLWDGDMSPNIWTRGHYLEYPPIIWVVKSSPVVFIPLVAVA